MASRRVLLGALARSRCPYRPSIFSESYTTAATRLSTASASAALDASKIPLSSIEAVVSREKERTFFCLSAKEYHAALQSFTEAVRRGADPRAVSLQHLTPDIMHVLACILRHIWTTTSRAFVMALWASASSAGHRAATLSLVRLLIQDKRYGTSPELRPVEERFKQLLQRGATEDRDALTLQGELLFQQGRLGLAATTLQRALHLHQDSDPVGTGTSDGADAGRALDFEWRPYCVLCLARVRAAMGRREDAKELLESLAAGPEGFVAADVELVRLGLLTPEEARQSMYNAACHGRRDMFERLAESEVEGPEKNLWVLEWSRLAGAA